MVDLEWYRSFLAIYRVGTVTGAAQELALTQPAVTQHLQALEAAIGVTLFTRTPRRMVPTERGKALYSAVVQAVETLEQAGQGRGHPAADVLPVLRLGAPREYFLVAALPALQAVPLRLEVQFGTARALLDALDRDALDLVVATERLSLSRVEYRKLAEEQFVLVGGAALASPVEVEALAAWLAAQPWVSYGTDLPIIRRWWREALGRRLSITPRLVVPDLLAVVAAVAAGWGISVVPSYLCAEVLAAGRLQELWRPPQPITNDLHLAFRSRDRLRPELVLAAAALRNQPERDGVQQ